MNPLVEYLTGRAAGVEREELHRLVARREWFTTARRARALLLGLDDGALALPLGCRPTVPPAVAVPPAVSVAPAATVDAAPVEALSSEESIIDRFLEHGGYRIAPGEKEDAIEDVECFAGGLDEDLATEELAEIYRSQGHGELADEIYRVINLRKS